MTANTCLGTQTGTVALAEKDKTCLTIKEIKNRTKKYTGDKETQNILVLDTIKMGLDIWK